LEFSANNAASASPPKPAPIRPMACRRESRLWSHFRHEWCCVIPYSRTLAMASLKVEKFVRRHESATEAFPRHPPGGALHLPAAIGGALISPEEWRPLLDFIGFGGPAEDQMAGLCEPIFFGAAAVFK